MDRLIFLATFFDLRSSNCSQILLGVSLTHGGHLAHLSGRPSSFGRGCCDRLECRCSVPLPRTPLCTAFFDTPSPRVDQPFNSCRTLMLGNRVGTGRRSGGRHHRTTASAHSLGRAQRKASARPTAMSRLYGPLPNDWQATFDRDLAPFAWLRTDGLHQALHDLLAAFATSSRRSRPDARRPNIR